MKNKFYPYYSFFSDSFKDFQVLSSLISFFEYFDH